jgi:hypothetical protein
MSAEIASQRFAYGPTAIERLDVYASDLVNAPINVFIHGGAWRTGLAEDYAFPAELFVRVQRPSLGITHFIGHAFCISSQSTIADHGIGLFGGEVASSPDARAPRAAGPTRPWPGLGSTTGSPLDHHS